MRVRAGPDVRTGAGSRERAGGGTGVAGNVVRADALSRETVDLGYAALRSGKNAGASPWRHL